MGSQDSASGGLMINLSIDGVDRTIEPEVLVVAGYTGADQAAVQHHIDELAAEGVAPPPRVPMYWSMPPSVLNQQSSITMPSAGTSGELELALVVDGSDMFLSAGSDHTCRIAEAVDIRLSKLICPTPLSTQAWAWADVAETWEVLELSSQVEIEGELEPYQSAAAGGNVAPMDLLAGIPWGGSAPQSYVLLCGTVPAIGGIRPADRFTGTVTDPASGRTLTLDYRVEAVAELGP